MAPRAKIEALPEDVRRWLERALTESGFSGYEALEAMLRDKGFQISKSAIHRYGQKIERRFAAIKASTEAARLLTEGAADDQDARSEAVIALVQTEIFDTIVNMQEASSEEISDAERLGMMSEAAKNIATLTRASVTLKRFQAEVRARIKAASEKVEDLAKSGGMTPSLIDSIKREILGIAG
ncbi:MAG: DUF3486 family protein [Proteobacteria bacterium]|nr:DUF3486 family protein [Pseudomonadota bacterium]